MVQIRHRNAADMAALEALAREVHRVDGYPPYLPHDDFVGFLDYAGAIASWVAVIDERVVGQISLHQTSSRQVMALAAERLDRATVELAVVARLLVDHGHRRSGVARSLLSGAVDAAVKQGRVPILDVVDRFAAAIALYEHEGWMRLGTVTIDLPDGSNVTEHVYTWPRS